MIDIQSTTVVPKFAIEAVGVTTLKYPAVVRDQATGEVQHVVADWQMSVSLPADRRGTHMSRFVADLDQRGDKPLDLDGLLQFATALKARLDADVVELRAEFTWFRRIKAPVTGQSALLESRVQFLARTGVDVQKTMRVQVAAKALCPCSKAISDRGAHNQRSDLSATLTWAEAAPVAAIPEVLALMEASASSPVYPLLKREDEKYVTEAAYDNPVFVEDLVRNMAGRLVLIPALSQLVVEAINRESIHAHDCFARISWRP